MMTTDMNMDSTHWASQQLEFACSYTAMHHPHKHAQVFRLYTSEPWQ